MVDLNALTAAVEAGDRKSAVSLTQEAIDAGISPDVILGAEARGFIFGGALAYALGCGFVPARKPGKLPWETVEATFDLEYGTDTLQVHKDALGSGSRVVVLDDVLATGGTANAKIELVERLGGVVVGALFVIELGFLHGRDRLDGYDVHALIEY